VRALSRRSVAESRLRHENAHHPIIPARTERYVRAGIIYHPCLPAGRHHPSSLPAGRQASSIIHHPSMKYRIAAVSYVNTLPFLYGLKQHGMREITETILAHPARCAELLQKGEVDIALCPVGALPGIGEYHVITDYCIGCNGPVRTVGVYSNRPFNELTHVVLSPESRTSNLLVQILNGEYWKREIEFIPAMTGSAYGSFSTGFLYIGDVCFQKEKEFTYRTDLGQAWKEWTGLPFVFACWISREKTDDDFVEKLNTAFLDGIRNLEGLTFPAGIDTQVYLEYLKRNISFEFDQGKKTAMKIFLEYVRKESD
jgi:chorismate dehydratase